MTKSFKKALACMLAVLMVAFSVPFTAFAAATTVVTKDLPFEDYQADINLQFGTLWDANAMDSMVYTGQKLNGNTVMYGGPMAPALTATKSVNKTTGALEVSELKFEASKAASFVSWFNNMVETDEDYGYDVYTPIDADSLEDVTFEEGNVFTVTVRLDNVRDLTELQFGLGYSDNIAPAGQWQKTASNRGWGTQADYTAQAAKSWNLEPTGQHKNLALLSGETFYGNKFENDDTMLNRDDYPLHYVHFMSTTGGSVNTSSIDLSEAFLVNPETGAPEWEPENQIIATTFMFKIVDEVSADNPIVFSVYDPQNNKAPFIGGYEGGSVVGVDDNIATTYVAYAANPDNADCSYGVYFSGYNVNSGVDLNEGGETPHEHSYTWAVTTPAVEPTCTTAGATAIETGTCECGDTQTRGGEEIAALGHDYVGTPTAPTCTEAGYTTYVCSRCQDTYTESGAPATGHTAAAAVQENVVAPTCTAAGSYDSVVYCSVCGAEISRTAMTGEAALGHDWGEWTEVTPATEQSEGLKRRECSRCDAFEEEAIPMLDHTHTPAAAVEENRVEATCTVDGSYDTVVYCSACGAELSRTTNTIPALGHDYQDYEAAVAATCTEDGKEATQKCSRCDDVIGGAVIPATGHTAAAAVTENEVAATCTEAGSYDSVVYCSVCNAEISRTTETIAALGHDWSEWTVVTPATKTKKGEEKRTCSRCDAVETQEIASLPIAVTVQGDATMGAVDGIAINTTSEYSFGDAFTLTAQPADGYAFICWKINGKVVGENAIYRSKAYADVTIEPVFAKAEAESFDVVFLDLYKNVVKTQTVTSGAEIVAPTDAEMVRNGYVFKGWNIDDFTTITAPCEIKGQYDYDDAANGYTVTVLGTDSATIDGENATEKTGVKFDTKVTVSAEGAIGWKIGETVVATGDTYTFYVGSDVTVTAVFDGEVAKENKIVILDNYGLIPNSDYRYQFVATRTLASGAKAEKVGFVYGKNLADDELVIDKAGQNGAAADAGQIKVGYNNFTDGVLETVLQYGIKAKAGTIKARAFMIVNGEVIYSDIVTVSY